MKKRLFSLTISVLLFQPAWAQEDLFESIRISSSQIEPGHALAIAVESRQTGLDIQVIGLGQKIKLANLPEEPNRWLGYLAVPLEAKPQSRGLTLTARANTQIQSQIIGLQVLPYSRMRIERIYIRNFGKFNFAPESRIIAAARRRSQGQLGFALHQFSPPLPNGQSNENFGVKRIYNRGLDSWRHQGVDIDSAAGTPILAPWDGAVLLAENFQAHGKTVLLDHGFGVVSTYLHQSKILVKMGERVAAGQAIGLVGATGSATGPHLHFQINVHNLAVDPNDFLNHDLQPAVMVYP